MSKHKKIVTASDLGDIKHDLVGRVLRVLQGRVEFIVEVLAGSDDPKVQRCVKALVDVVLNLRTSVAQLDEAILVMARAQRTQAWRELAEGRERLDPTGRYAKKGPM